jgi:DNA-binding NtrC family response regulator
MMSANEAAFRSRVLILAPVGRDAALTRSLLNRAGVESLGCSNLDDLRRKLIEGAGAAVITEEALIGCDISDLVDWVAQQPSWSDFPFVVLLEPGASAEAVGQERDALQQSGNLTLLERPVGEATLVSAVRAALRARGRQYEVHDALVALTVSERRYRTLAEALPQLVWTSRPMASGIISVGNGSNTPAFLRKSNLASPGSTRSFIPRIASGSGSAGWRQ